MKRLLPFIALCFAALSFTHAQVTSVNAVGMVKITINRGELELIQTPFVSGAGDPTIPDLFGTTLPPGTKVYWWETEGDDSQTYKSALFSTDPFNPGADGTWSDTTKTFKRGEGFFVSIPDTAEFAQYDVVLSGEVPDSVSAPTTAQTIVMGLQMLGLAYPVSVPLTDTDSGTMETNPILGLNATVGDKIFIWSSTSGWTSSTYTSDPFAPADPPTWTSMLTFEPGVSVFYQSVDGSTTWVSTKVNFYSWP